MKLLIIEDEEDMLAALKKGFEKKGYIVDTAADGAEGYELYQLNAYDLIVLDLNLPSMDGLEVLSAIREEDQEQRILILSARSKVEDRITGLDMGANDYLPKPFAFGELDARVRSLLRRETVQKDVVLTAGDLRLNTRTKTAFGKGEALTLAPREYAILEYLLMHKGKVISSETLLDHMWDSEVNLFTDSVKVHISNIRKKLKDAGMADCIKTVRGSGYGILEEEEE